MSNIGIASHLIRAFLSRKHEITPVKQKIWFNWAGWAGRAGENTKVNEFSCYSVFAIS